MGKIALNENQQKAVQYVDGDLLIIAGAGTGKTAVITQRILHLIKKCRFHVPCRYGCVQDWFA